MILAFWGNCATTCTPIEFITSIFFSFFEHCASESISYLVYQVTNIDWNVHTESVPWSKKEKFSWKCLLDIFWIFLIKCLDSLKHSWPTLNFCKPPFFLFFFQKFYNFKDIRPKSQKPPHCLFYSLFFLTIDFYTLYYLIIITCLNYIWFLFQ